MIRYRETKQFWRKIVILTPSLIANFFRYQIFCRTQKGSSTKLLGTVGQNVLTEKRENTSLPPSLPPSLPTSLPPSLPPSLLHSFLSIILFDTKKFVEHRRVPLLFFLLLRDNTVWRKIVILVLSLIANFFSIPEFFSNTEGVLYEFFTHCETKIFDRKTW